MIKKTRGKQYLNKKVFDMLDALWYNNKAR